MATPPAWPAAVADGLLDVQLAFDAQARADGAVDADEAAIAAALVELQEYVGAVHEDIVAYCHTIRVGRPSGWHARKARERATRHA